MDLSAIYIERIEELSYTESEARFLYIVAVFSGYFTLRQFRAITGSRFGKRPTSFAQKLIGKGHARVCAQSRRGSLPSLFQNGTPGTFESTFKATEDDNPQVRLEEEVRNNLDRDAEFIDADPSYVVSEILKLLHHKDREFQSWLSGQRTNNREPVLKGETLQLELK